MNNRDRLIDLMMTHKLDRRDVANLVRVTREVVDRWLLPPESRSREPMPDMAIELLELKLDRRAATPEAGG